MRNIRTFSAFVVATAASVWTSGALAGGGGGYALVCNSVSPTQGCSIQLQQVNINIVFEQTKIVNNYNILDQEILSPSVPQQVVSQPTQQQYTPPAQQQYTPPAQQQYTPPAQQQYTPPAQQAQQQYTPPVQQQYTPPTHQHYAPAQQRYASQQRYAPAQPQYAPSMSYQKPERYVEAIHQNRQMETAYLASEVKVKEFEETKSGYSEIDRRQVDYSFGGEHNQSRGDEIIFIDSIVTLLGRL